MLLNRDILGEKLQYCQVRTMVFLIVDLTSKYFTDQDTFIQDVLKSQILNNSMGTHS